VATDNPFGAPSETGWAGESDAYGTGRWQTIRRVGVLSVGKVLGTLYTVIGLIVAFFLALAMLVAPGEVGPAGIGAGISMIIFMPILYGLGGLLFGIIIGALYNLIAGLIGGVEIEFEIRG
jgi:hypothetical protein